MTDALSTSDVVTVREATTADEAGWVEVWDAVATERRWIGMEGPLEREVLADRFRHNFDDPTSGMLTATVGGRIVGVLNVHLRYGTAEFGMCVAADQRGHGVGTALLAACIDWARAHDAHKVGLQVWPHNTAAIALYEKLGFVQEGRLRRQWRRSNGELWDSIVMGLVLDETSPGCPW